jgi:ABC-type multidrug transport system fused ATPase/permease subunit
MPALQQIYSSFTRLTFIKSLQLINYSDLKNLKLQNTTVKIKNILTFNKSIVLNHIHYNYPNSTKTALKNINLTIPAKSTVGLIGSTGCGKTTTIDIILGLLRASKRYFGN